MGLWGFAISVCEFEKPRLVWVVNMNPDVFTINAVSQDDFEDVKVPDAPKQSPILAGATAFNGGSAEK